jgi:IS30 family transposase
MANNTREAIQTRREQIWTLLTRGFKGCEIAKELNTTAATVSRDIDFLVNQSNNYLEDLAKKTLPFMYQTSLEIIREVVKQAWIIYNTEDTNYFQKLAALKLIKESGESMFSLLADGPAAFQLGTLQSRLEELEQQQQHSQQQQQQQHQLTYNNQIST